MSEVDTFKYVNVHILRKDEKTGEYYVIRAAGYGIAGRPFKGDFIRVDGASYEVEKVEFDTERGSADFITVYVA